MLKASETMKVFFSNTDKINKYKLTSSMKLFFNFELKEMHNQHLKTHHVNLVCLL